MDTSKNTDIGLLLLRLCFGGAMLYGHGWGKLMRLFGDDPIKFADPFGLGPEFSLYLVIFAEVVCAFLLMIGLFSRQVTIPLIITMLVAVFMVHISDPFGKMEKGLLYLITYISLLFMGPGRYSVDEWLRNR